MSPLSRILDLVVPSTCAGCGLPGPVLCTDCRAALRRGPGVPCATCGHPWPIAVAACPECPPRLAALRHLCGYGPTARAVVSAIKDRHRVAVVGALAGMVAAVIGAPPAGVPLVPVPLTARRERERGFNQSEVLARELGRAWNRPVLRALRRTGAGAPQRGASRTARQRQVRGVFEAVPEDLTDVRAAVIVDDVMTTGSTLGACARALHGAGVPSVGAVVVARVERSVGRTGDRTTHRG